MTKWVEEVRFKVRIYDLLLQRDMGIFLRDTFLWSPKFIYERCRAEDLWERRRLIWHCVFIGNSAFRYCAALSSLYRLLPSLSQIGSWAFGWWHAVISIHPPGISRDYSLARVIKTMKWPFEGVRVLRVKKSNVLRLHGAPNWSLKVGGNYKRGYSQCLSQVGKPVGSHT